MSFKLIRTPYVGNDLHTSDGKRITIELCEDTDLAEMLLAFEGFLRASGYQFDGSLEIVEEDPRPEPLGDPVCDDDGEE